MKSARSCIVALSLLALAGIPGVALAQFGPMEQDVGNSVQAYPELVLDQTKIELGTISDEEPKSMKVGFKNAGAAKLIISSIRGSCGCTVPQLAKMEYAPGEGGTLDITFNPHGKRDAQHTTVTIASNDRTHPSAVIDILSTVRPTVSCDPMNVAFNQLAKGKGATQQVKVVGRLPNFAATEVTVSNPEVFEAKILSTEPVAQPDGKEATQSIIEVTVKPGAPVGMAQAMLTIRTSDPKYIQNVQTFVEVTGEVIASPSKFYLNMIPASQPFSVISVLRHRDNKPFTIKDAKVVPMAGAVSHEASVEFKADNDQKTSYSVTLKGKAPETQAAVQGDVILTTDIPGEETIKLGYFGMSQVQGAGPGQGFKPNPVGPAGGAVIAQPAKVEPAKK